MDAINFLPGNSDEIPNSSAGMTCYNDTCLTDVQFETDIGVSTDDVQSFTYKGTSAKDVKPNNDTGVSPDDVQINTDTGVSPNDVQPKNNTGVSPNDIQPNIDTGVSPNDVQLNNDTGVSPNDVQLNTDTGMSSNNIQSNTQTGVSLDDVQPNTDTGVSTDDVQPNIYTGVSPNGVQPNTDTGVTPDNVQPNTDTGVSSDDVQLNTDTGVSSNDVQPNTQTGVSLDDVQLNTDTSLTSNNVQPNTDTSVSTNDVQLNTDTGVSLDDVQLNPDDTSVTSNDVKPNTDTGVSTNDVQQNTDTGVTSNNVQLNTDTGVTPDNVQPNTDTGVSSNDVQLNTDTGVSSNDVQQNIDTGVSPNDVQPNTQTGVSHDDVQSNICQDVLGQDIRSISIEPADPCSPVMTFDLLGPVGERLLCPTCVSVSMTGEFVVSDTESCFVVIYSSSGLYLSHFSTIPKRMFYMFIDVAKHRPQDVAWLASKHVVYTQPAGCRVVVADWKGKSTVAIEGRPLYEPYGVCVDKYDKIYVTDRSKGRILCYNTDGKLIKSLGVLGSREVLDSPHYIRVTNNGNICVNELCKEGIRVQVYTKTGTSFCVIAKGDNHDVGSMAVDPDGYVLQVDQQCGHLVVCRPTKLNGYSLKAKTTIGFNGQKDKNTCLLVSKTLTPKIGGIALTDSDRLVCIDRKDKQVKAYLWKNHKEMLVSL